MKCGGPRFASALAGSKSHVGMFVMGSVMGLTLVHSSGAPSLPPGDRRRAIACGIFHPLYPKDP